MKMKIIITGYDNGTTPRSATVKGKTDKELIYDLFQKTDEWVDLILEDDHPLVEATYDGYPPFEEVEHLINFNTLEDFKNFVEDSTGYRLSIQPV